LKQKLPLAVCFIMGIVMIIQYFVPALSSIYDVCLQWLLVITGFTIVLGIYSLVRMHYFKIKRRIPGWGYSVVTIVGLIWMLSVGFIWGNTKGTPFQNTYFLIQVPIQSTMFSLLAFYIASAAFRAFRMKNLEAGLLLAAAIIVMIGQVPVGATFIPGIASLKEWILNVPNLAAKRGILMGIGLGMLSTSLKIILGIERSYLSGG
jgi:hypothetical protein